MEKEPYKLHWITPASVSYNNFLFHNIGNDPEIDLTVHFTSESHPWKSTLAQGFFFRVYKTKFGIDWHLVSRAITDKNSFFIVQGWEEPTRQLVLTILGIRKYPFAIWTDTPWLNRRRPFFKALARSTWLRLIFRSACVVMGTGKPAIEALTEMGCPKEKLTSFPFFVPLPEIGLLKTNKRKHRTIFLSCGQLEERKGYDIAIEAFARAIELCPDQSSKFIICGEGTQRYSLEAKIRSLGMERHIILPGWQEASDIERHLLLCDAFVHPARRDPFPVAVLEAMAFGKPVLGSNHAGSVLERVSHKMNGLIHKCGDREELASHMAFVMQDPGLTKNIGYEARRTAEEWPVQKGVKMIKEIIKRYS